MTNTEELQQQVFQTIKRKIPAHISVAEEIAGVLDISADSAYRRLRSEKTISLDELYKLCIHYHISLDQMLNIQTGAILFNGLYVNENSFRFDEYLKGVLNNLAYFNSFKHTEIYWLCKDIPLNHHFHLREIAAFKYFFWMKTILHSPEFRTRKVKFQEYPEEMFELGRRGLELYQKPSVIEFWNIEGINSTIRQIEFYRDSDIFESDKDAYAVYEALEKLLNHLEKQADLGYQFQIDDKEMKPLGSFQMYYNEVFLGDNSGLIIMDGQKLVIVSHSAINYMNTRDEAFCEHTNEHIRNLKQKSTLISSANEKERSRFFKTLRDKITNRKKALKV